MITYSIKVEGGYEIWEINSYYEIKHIIGIGAFGTVCIGMHKPSSMIVAIKRIHNVFDDIRDCRRIVRELQMLRSLRHPSIVRIIDIMMPKDIKHFNDLYVVLEFVPTDLFQLIRKQQTLNSAQIKKIMFNILQAIKYLHSSYVVHRDLKPENILIDEDCQIKLCDFDLARKIKNVSSSISPVKSKQTGKNKKSSAKGLILDDISDEISPSQSILEVNDYIGGFGHQNNLTTLSLQINSQKIRNKNQDKEITEQNEKIAEEDELNEKGDTISTILYRDIESQTSNFPSNGIDSQENSNKHKLAEKITQVRADVSKNNRKLSDHVCTRFYRAPEIIVQDKNYGFSIDIWSLGCIFAELLQLKTPKKNSRMFSPLFKGTSCLPMSPKSGSEDNLDQIDSILNIVGPMSEDDLSFIDDLKIRNSLSNRTPKITLNQICVNSTEEEMSLLKKMLEFNPFFRYNIEQCINHNYFQDCTDRYEFEFFTDPINIPDNDKNSNLNQLKTKILDEISYYKSQANFNS